MASADLFIRAGDTTPVFTDAIKDQNGNALNLTGATVTFVLRSLQSSTAVALTGVASVTNGAAGAVQFAWGASDTASAGAGLYNAEWHVTLSGGGTYTYPNDGYRTVSIEQALVTAPQQLVSVADAKSYLNITSSDKAQDVALQRFISAARPVIENVVGPIIPQQFEEWHDGGSTWISLRRKPSFAFGTSPLLTLLACSEYNGPIEWPLAIIASPDIGQLYSCMLDQRLGRVVRRTAGGGVQAFPYAPQAVHVIYEAGQNVVPANVYEATLEAIRINYRQTQPVGGGLQSPIDTAEQGERPIGFFLPRSCRELLEPTRRFPSLA